MLAELLTTFRATLRIVTICNQFASRKSFQPLIALYSQSNVDLQFNDWPVEYSNSYFNGGEFEEKNQLSYLEPAISTALKYGERKLSTLKKEEDLEGMKEMFENCRWLRASAAEMMD